MKTLNVLIVCLSCIILFGGIAYLVWMENITENPYEQCLKFCSDDVYFNERYSCIEMCHNDFKDILFELSDKFFPIVEQMLEQEFSQNSGSTKQ